MEDVEIYKRLKKQYNKVLNEGYNILFIALQGSQNYGLDTDNSDVDSIAVILPIFDNYAYQQSPVSTTIITDDNEHIEVKDIREICKLWKKQNTHFLQILFTSYKIVNKQYREYVDCIYNMAEDIANINRKYLYNNICGMARACYQNLINKDKIDTYNPKQLYHLVRFDTLYSNLEHGMSYKKSLTTFDPEIKKVILECKNNSYEFDKAQTLAEFCVKHIVNYVHLDIVQHNYETNINIINKLDAIVKHLLIQVFVSEVVPDIPNININKYKHVFLTSDNHFGHYNIIKYENRDINLNISTLEEHDNKMIELWNSIVKKDDLVFILGDFSFYKAEKTIQILKQLNGDKVLIEGNHDIIYLQSKTFDKTLFKEIVSYKEINYKGTNICLMHYPIQVFKHIDKTVNPYIHLHGHIHSNPYLVPKHSYNVGVDINGYKPILIEEAIYKALNNNGGEINGRF